MERVTLEYKYISSVTLRSIAVNASATARAGHRRAPDKELDSHGAAERSRVDRRRSNDGRDPSPNRSRRSFFKEDGELGSAAISTLSPTRYLRGRDCEGTRVLEGHQKHRWRVS